MNNKRWTDPTAPHGPGIVSGSPMSVTGFDEVRFPLPVQSPPGLTATSAEDRELTILLLVDLSAPGHLAAEAVSERELAAKIASLLAFSTLRQNDRLGLVLYSDRIERYIPPKKGRRHAMRLLCEIIFTPLRGRGADKGHALEFAARILRRHPGVTAFCAAHQKLTIMGVLQRPSGCARRDRPRGRFPMA